MEVRNKLYELGCSAGEIERRISELIETGVLNEERYARAFAGGKFRMKQWGREKIKQQLRLRKISDYCIKKALKEIDETEYDRTLNKLAYKKVNDTRADKSVLSRKSKVYRFLIQKGYECDLVMDVINTCFKK